jgi:4-amino-4-deoxy-L-arabinose transferase-like glycosyltransferase
MTFSLTQDQSPRPVPPAVSDRTALDRTATDRPPLARAGVGFIAVAAVAVELAVSARYGYHRDELYFLAAGQHLSFGYVDQPALTPLLARLSAALTGNTLVGLRLLPALSLGLLVVLTAAISRRLGAGRPGQLLAAAATATCAEYLGALHLMSTTTPDLVAWAVTLYLVVRLLEGHDPRWWLAIGAVAGVGLDAKWNIAFLAAALLAGFAATGPRSLLRSRYLLLGAVLAAVLGSPDLVWQAMHGWPNLAVFHTLQGDAGANRITYWIAQVVYTGPALTPVWVTGLVWSLRSEAMRRFRPLPVACAAVLVLQFVLGGKAYYPAGVFVFLFAAGAVPIGRKLADRRVLRGHVSALAARLAVTVAVGAVGAVIALPLLPAAALHTVPLQKINYDLAETIAWPKLTALVAREYQALPAGQRARTTILAGNYGEAGAIARYGARYHLPTAYSGQNNFWLWGPPPARDTSAVAVGLDPALLHREFAHVRQVATFRNGLGVDDDEQGNSVYVVSGRRTTWRAAWPAFRDYS